MTRKPLAALLIAAVVVAGVVGWRLHEKAPAEAQPIPVAAAVPIEAALTKRADVPVFLRGLGNVQAFNTVTIKVRVDGQLEKVAFTEGQTVKAGDLLAQIDPRPFQAQLDQAVAKKAQDEALLANARRDLDRFLKLAARDYATAQSVDTQRAMVAQLTAEVAGDEAAIENAQVQLGYTTIVSPINGRTGIRLVDQGNIVHATDTTGLVVVTQMKPISVVFTLPEETLASINAAMAQGPLKVLAMSQDEKSELAEGTLAVVDNMIDMSTGTARLKATFPNENGALWPGQFVNVRLTLRIERNVLTVPAIAVQRGPDGLYAYVVKPDQTVEMRPLDVGQIDDGIAVVEHGLADGERVVTAGHYRLQPGAKVEIHEPGTTAAEG